MLDYWSHCYTPPGGECSPRFTRTGATHAMPILAQMEGRIAVLLGCLYPGKGQGSIAPGKSGLSGAEAPHCS